MKRIKIFIPNVTTPRNLGDAAMHISLVSLLKRTFPFFDAIIATGEPEMYTKEKSTKVILSLFDWLVWENSSLSARLSRLFLILLYVISFECKAPWLRKHSKLNSLISYYYSSDLIIFQGCGFLRSRTGVKQSINLLFTLLPFLFAKYSSAPVVISPLGFGPFAYLWQEKLVARVLSTYKYLYFRDENSLQRFRQHYPHKGSYSCDHGLLLKCIGKKNSKVNTIAFNVRPWLRSESQRDLEALIATSLYRMQRKYQTTLLPYVQVNAPAFPQENDTISVERVCTLIKSYGGVVEPIVIPTTIEQSKQILSNVSLLLSMRMHANILAATEYTPFLALAYEDKTIGISKTIEMEKYTLRLSELEKTLDHNLEEAYLKKAENSKHLKATLSTINVQQREYWCNFLKTII